MSRLTVTATEDEGKPSMVEKTDNISTLLPNSRMLPTGRNEDITAAFNRASTALRQGQLVKDDYFTLFESVGALEIMDPKMDSGFILPEEDAALEEFDPLNHTLPEEIIWIMDQMLCFEMLWHEGAPLSQTLFTSLHLYNILSVDYLPLEHMLFKSSQGDARKYPLVSSILRAYCLSIAKCLDNVIMEITSEHFYEEEDFISATFSRLFVNRIDDDDFISLLEDALADLEKLSIDDSLREAIKVRLRARVLMVEAFRPEPMDVRSLKPDAFRSIKQLLPELDGSHATGKETKIPVFSERVQRHLASNTPPRPMLQTSWPDTVKKLNQMCDDVVAAFGVTALYPEFVPSALMRFVWSFSSRIPQPHTYSRAVMQGLLFKSSSVLSTYPHLDLLLSDIRTLVLPASSLLFPQNWETELPSSPRFQIARKLDDFLTRSLEEYLNLYRMPLQNRCRIRRTFAQSIPILDSLQALAEETDASLTTICRTTLTTRDPILPGLGESGANPAEAFFPLASWVYHHKLLAIEVVLQTGFELEVYLPDEFAPQYALLSFFAQTRAEHYGYLTTVLSRRLSPISPSPSRRAPPIDPTSIQEIKKAISHLSILASQARLLAALASALCDLYALLSLLDLIPVPQRPFSTPELRHELRMRPFLAIGTPMLPSMEELEDATTGRDGDVRLGAWCEEAAGKVGVARAEVGSLRSKGEEAGGKGGKESWEGMCKGYLFGVIGVGVGVAALRGMVKEVGVEKVGDVRRGEAEGEEERERLRGEVKRRVKVEIPKPEERRESWCVVPKITVVKAES
ncbi:hypothetical protein C1H76_8329 [Elsinoe australis]|uniref:Uncharacterized protein n=1 Tax=Elsinoe australis TaxID=40998 RepID=A0A4U7ASB2_9PEZI|nr:hypothetical protein C1H76_8329 [Elsinoe australis]